jgi:hypothetical protein
MGQRNEAWLDTTDHSNALRNGSFKKQIDLVAVIFAPYTTIKNCACRQGRIVALATSESRQILSDDVLSEH